MTTEVELDSSLLDSQHNEVTVYYDEACAMCRTGVRLLHRVMFLRHTRLIPGQQVPDVDQVMSKANTWVVVDQFGQIRTEFDALTYLCHRSPVFWPLYYLLRVPPVLRLGRHLYRFIATRRRRFGSRSASD